MPAKRKKEKVVGRYFTWLLGERNGIFIADGRSNPKDAGRHSLATRIRAEALELIVRLDVKKAVEFGLAPASVLAITSKDAITLAEGKDLYLRHVARPSVLGGATQRTVNRYRAVFDKFVQFALRHSVQHWQQVSKNLLESYGAWLDDEGYAYASEYLELTAIKQLLKWLVGESKIAAACLISLPLKKPQGTTTYCYTAQEVQAMLKYCTGEPKLHWLGDVILALATTGLRIGELSSLRWTDIDFASNMIRLADGTSQGDKERRAAARATKSHRDRALPIHADLQGILRVMMHHPDGHVFHGPLGGQLKPDTVRNVLTREVLAHLAGQFRTTKGEKGFVDGRLHSLRHYFCSASANSGVPEQVLMSWLGHQDSKMVRRYYHLHGEESQRQMQKLPLLDRERGKAG